MNSWSSTNWTCFYPSLCKHPYLLTLCFTSLSVFTFSSLCFHSCPTTAAALMTLYVFHTTAFQTEIQSPNLFLTSKSLLSCSPNTSSLSSRTWTSLVHTGKTPEVMTRVSGRRYKQIRWGGLLCLQLCTLSRLEPPAEQDFPVSWVTYNHYSVTSGILPKNFGINHLYSFPSYIL